MQDRRPSHLSRLRYKIHGYVLMAVGRCMVTIGQALVSLAARMKTANEHKPSLWHRLLFWLVVVSGSVILAEKPTGEGWLITVTGIAVVTICVFVLTDVKDYLYVNRREALHSAASHVLQVLGVLMYGVVAYYALTDWLHLPFGAMTAIGIVLLWAVMVWIDIRYLRPSRGEQTATDSVSAKGLDS